MPTVFDSPLAQLLLAQHATQQANPAAAPPAAPAAPPGRPPLEQAFSGPADPRLSAGENDRVRRQALMRAGATGLLATGNMQRGGLMSVIGKAALAGQTFASGEAKSILASRPEPGELETQVITRPDGSMDLINKQTGATIAPLGKAQAPERNLEAPKPVRLLNGEVVLASWDGKKGAYVGLDGQLLVGAIPQAETMRGVQTEFLGPDGQVYNVFRNPETGETIGEPWLAETPDPSKGFTTEQYEAASLAVPNRLSYGIIKNYLQQRMAENPENPLRGLRFDRLRYEQNGVLTTVLSQRHRIDPETQEFLNALGVFIDRIAHREAGVRGITAVQARDLIYRDFGFDEGDTIGNIEQTLQGLEADIIKDETIAGPEVLEMFRAQSGMDGFAPPTFGGPAGSGGAGEFSDLIPRGN